MTAPDVDTTEGKAWLRRTILAYVKRKGEAAEDRILRHVDRKAGEDYEGTMPSGPAVDMLYAMVANEHVLDWREKRGDPDAPLRYRLWPEASGGAP